MKVVKLSHPNYEYDVHSLVKAFYAEDQVTVITPETKPEKLAALGIRVRALSSYYHDQSEDLHCLVINYSGLKEERLSAALAAISGELA